MIPQEMKVLSIAIALSFLLRSKAYDLPDGAKFNQVVVFFDIAPPNTPTPP